MLVGERPVVARRGRRCPTRRSRRRGRCARRCGGAASSSEPSSVGRMIDCASESGFSSVTTRRIGCSAGRRRRSSSAGLGEAPADDLVQAAPDQRVLGARGARAGRGSARPAAPRRAGSVAGRRSRPSMRATSSIRSTSRVTSSRRSAGTRHLAGRRSAGSAAKSSAARISRLALARDRHAEDRLDARGAQRGSRGGGAPGPPTSIVPGQHASRRTARSSARRDRLGVHALLRLRGPSRSAPEASLRRPSAHEVRWMFGPFQVATSSSTRVVSRLDLRARAAHHARRSRSGPRRPRSRPSRASSVRVWPSSVCDLLAVARAAHGQRARRRRGRGRRRAAAGRSAASRSW